MAGFLGSLDREGGPLARQIWGDVRLDGKRDLIRKFDAAERRTLEAATDTELLLRCYERWDEGCVQHLIGDFCFALWDRARRRLFCARDQFGVKPFFYALTGDGLVFSNRLAWMRAHPGVSDDLNELAVADFLLFGSNQDPSLTVFTDVRRLPAAHTLTWRSGTLQVQRYWTLPVSEPIRYRRAGDYAERFQELLDTAVAERTGARTAMLMSGGLDSTAVAASATRTLANVKAFTVVYDRLIPDQERHFSGIAARALDVPVQYLAADTYDLYEWRPELQTPEPLDEPLCAVFTDHLRQVSDFSPLALSGHGGDPVLLASPDLAAQMIRTGRWGELASGAWQYMRSHGGIPRIGVRTAVRRSLGSGPGPQPQPELPCWLNPELERNWNLRQRASQLQAEPSPVHLARPRAYDYLTRVFWPNLFESYDPGFTNVPVEIRHPFFDVRLVTYALAVPPLPWFVDKTMLRAATRGRLPDVVRLRSKTPAGGDSIAARLPYAPWVDEWQLSPMLERFVDRKRIPKLAIDNGANWRPHLRPFSLNFWLQHLPKS